MIIKRHGSMKIQKREGSYKRSNVYKSTKDEIHNYLSSCCIVSSKLLIWSSCSSWFSWPLPSRESTLSSDFFVGFESSLLNFVGVLGSSLDKDSSDERSLVDALGLLTFRMSAMEKLPHLANRELESFSMFVTMVKVFKTRWSLSGLLTRCSFRSECGIGR